MALTSRIKRLERFHRTTECPVCRGKPPWVVSYINEGEPTPVVDGCAHCGAVQQIVVQFVDESLPGGPKVESSKIPATELAKLFAPRTC